MNVEPIDSAVLIACFEDNIKARLQESFNSETVDKGLFEIVDSRRLFHGRGQFYPGLDFIVVDLFYPAIVITVFDQQTAEFESSLITSIVKLAEQFNVDNVLVQRRYHNKPSFEPVLGDLPEPFYAQRAGLRYSLNTQQQNIGFFLDIEPARQWLEKYSHGSNVLNLFSYTCTFSVVAKAAGAKGVVNMDLSSRSLNSGRESHRINQVPLDGVSFFANDILKSWSRLKRCGPYDLVIIDPPSFQKGSFIAKKDYAKVLRRMASLTRVGARVLVCLNAPEVPYSQFREEVEASLEGFEFEQRLEGHQDFPDADTERALKMLVYIRQ